MPDHAPQTATAPRLYAAARYHARAALDLAQAPWDAHSALDVATRAGSVVELLAKTLLVHHDERLVTHRDAHQHLLDFVLHRAGMATPSAFKPNKQTVDARVAVELVQRLSPDIERHGRAAIAIVLRARNDAVHMAVPRGPTDLETVLTRMSDFADAILAALDLGAHEFWGDHAPAVQRRVIEHREEVLLGARAAVDAARRKFEDFSYTIGEDALATVLTALQERGPQEAGDLSAELECPACGNVAIVSWSTEVEVDVDHGETIYYPYYVLNGLRCPVCSLHLDADQLDSLRLEDMPNVDEVAAADQETDLESFYES